MVWDFFEICEDIYIQTQRPQLILEAILNSLNNVIKGGHRGSWGHNWEKYFIGLFHVSQHLGHF